MRPQGISLAFVAVLAVTVLMACGGGSKVSGLSTNEALAKLQRGMTPEQVRSSLGDPEQQTTVPNQTGEPGYQTLTMYGYDTEDAKLVVIFHDGKVADFRGTDQIQLIPSG